MSRRNLVGVNPRRVPAIDRILAAKQKNPAAATSALEREIASQPRRVFPKQLTAAIATRGDQHVYALYNLTPEEIKIVESASAHAAARHGEAAK